MTSIKQIRELAEKYAPVIGLPQQQWSDSEWMAHNALKLCELVDFYISGDGQWVSKTAFRAKMKQLGLGLEENED